MAPHGWVHRFIRLAKRNIMVLQTNLLMLFYNFLLVLLSLELVCTCNFSLVAILPFRSMIYTDLRLIGPTIDIAVLTVQETLRCRIKVVTSKEKWQNDCDDMESNIVDFSARLFHSSQETDRPVGLFVGVGCTFANKELIDLLQSKWHPSPLLVKIGKCPWITLFLTRPDPKVHGVHRRQLLKSAHFLAYGFLTKTKRCPMDKMMNVHVWSGSYGNFRLVIRAPILMPIP